MKIKLLHPKCKPTKGYKLDAGMDLRARLTRILYLDPGERHTIGTGICVAVPVGHVGDIRPRSGLATREGIITTYGTIDPGYTGEISVCLVNIDPYEVRAIEPFQRVAQFVLVRTGDLEDLEYVEELPGGSRGAMGFGSTGKS